jgi:hypothetical protein
MVARHGDENRILKAAFLIGISLMAGEKTKGIEVNTARDARRSV